MKHVIEELIEIAFKAGEEIMRIYITHLEVEYEEDNSPLTEADKKAHTVIMEGLKKYPLILYRVRKEGIYPTEREKTGSISGWSTPLMEQ